MGEDRVTSKRAQFHCKEPKMAQRRKQMRRNAVQIAHRNLVDTRWKCREPASKNIEVSIRVLSTCFTTLVTTMSPHDLAQRVVQRIVQGRLMMKAHYFGMR